MSKISSSTESAKSAVSKLLGNPFSHQGPQVETPGSTLKCMHSAQKLNNEMLDDLNELVDVIQSQSKKVTGLAEMIEQRDQIDSQSWGF